MRAIVSGQRNRSGKRGRMTIHLVLLAGIFFGLSGPAFSGEILVVNGVVDRVSGRQIYLNGKAYDIGNAPVIVKGSGTQMQKAGIEQGDRVDLSIEDGKVVSVRDYGPLPQ